MLTTKGASNPSIRKIKGSWHRSSASDRSSIKSHQLRSLRSDCVATITRDGYFKTVSHRCRTVTTALALALKNVYNPTVSFNDASVSFNDCIVMKRVVASMKLQWFHVSPRSKNLCKIWFYFKIKLRRFRINKYSCIIGIRLLNFRQTYICRYKCRSKKRHM